MLECPRVFLKARTRKNAPQMQIFKPFASTGQKIEMVSANTGKSLQTAISNLTKNGRKLSKWVENTVGKGEIASNEQFLLLPQCF